MRAGDVFYLVVDGMDSTAQGSEYTVLVEKASEPASMDIALQINGRYKIITAFPDFAPINGQDLVSCTVSDPYVLTCHNDLAYDHYLQIAGSGPVTITMILF